MNLVEAGWSADAKYIERATAHPPVVIFKTATDPWTEFMLYLLDDDFYSKELLWITTLTLSSLRIRDFKNNWDMFKG